jgi:hypothetical protein
MAMVTILLLATAFMVYQGQKIQMSYQFSRLLPLTDSTQVDYDNFRATFNQAGNQVVLAAENIDVFNPKDYRLWKKLEQDLDTIDGVDNILSPISAYNLVRNDSTGKLEVVAFNDDFNAENSDSLGRLYRSLPFYEGLLYSKDGKSPLMLVQISNENLYNKSIIRIIEAVKTVVADFEKESGYVVHASGLPYIRMANTKKISQELFVNIALALGVTTLIMFLFLRSIRATLISMLVVILGVCWSFGLIASFGHQISMLSALIPSLIIVIGVPNCIFLINKYHAEYKGHKNKILAVQRVIRKIGAATLLTNTTTALGFAAFIFTDSVILREFGIVASINIMMVFVISIIIIPVVYSFGRKPKKRHYSHLEKHWLNGFVNGLTHLVQNYRVQVYIVSALLSIAGFYGATLIITTGNLTEEFKENDPLLTDLRFLETNFGGAVPVEIVIDTKRERGAQKLSVIKRLSKLQERLKEIPELSRSMSLADGVKFAKQAYYRGDSSFYSVPTTQESNFILSAIPESKGGLDLLNAMVDSTGQKVRISVQARDLPTKEIRALHAAVEERVYDVFDPERYDVTITGASMVFVKGTTYLIKNLIISLILAVCVIAVIMTLLFRSFKMVVVSLIPNLFPLLMTAGIMGYFNIPLKPSTILVFSIAFGISVDDTIHFLAKYRQELRSNGWNIAQAVLTSIRETGVSMFYTSIVLFFGFITFVSSSFGGIISLGILVSITLVIAMLSNLILLPTLLMSVARRDSNTGFNKPIISIYASDEENEDEFTDEDDEADESEVNETINKDL